MTKSEVERLPPHVRQITLYLSVLYSRPASLDVLPEEGYRCPLRDCAKSHNDLESLLAHIASCPKLDAAEYWCSNCRWFERIAKPHRHEYTGQQTFEQTRLSKLKRAFSFFRNFGRRNHSPSEMKNPQRVQHTNVRHELAANVGHHDRSAFELESPVLPVPGSELFGGETAQELSARKTRASMYTVYEHQEDENDYDDIAISSDCQVSPLVPLGTPNANFGGCTQRLSARLSYCGVSLGLSRAVDHGVYPVELESPPILGTSCSSLPDQNANQSDYQSPHRIFSQEIHKADNLSEGKLPTSTQFEQISRNSGAGDLHDVFTVLCQEWMSRLGDQEDLLMRVPSLSSDALFELGLSTLQGVLLGHLPQSFDSAFALMVVSFSCAYILYEHHHISCWDGLLREVPQWSLLISDLSDRVLFVRIIYKGLARQQENNGGHPAFLQRISMAAQQNMYQCTPDEPRIPAEAVGAQEDVGTLLPSLRSGQAVSVCSTFLDGEERAHDSPISNH